MSLINEMLSDLDSGRGHSTGNSSVKKTADDALLADSGLLRSSPATTWLPAAIAFVVVAALLLWQQYQREAVVADIEVGVAVENEQVNVQPGAPELKVARNNIDQSKSTPATVAIESAEKAALLSPNYYPKLLAAMEPELPESASETVESEVAVEADTVVSEKAESISAGTTHFKSTAHFKSAAHFESTASNDSAHQRQISQLLVAAAKALSVDRLLSPPEDNAADRYRAILAIQPNHQEAMAGLQSVARRYINLARHYVESGNRLRAKALLRRAEGVVPENAQISEEIAQARAELLSLRYQTVESVKAEERLLGEISAVPEAIAAPEPKTEVSLRPERQIVRVRSEDWRDADTAKKGQQLYAAGKREQARSLLQKYLAENPQSTESLDILLHLLIGSGETAKAQQYLANASHLSTADSIEYNAHILLATANLDAAIVLLESQQRQAINDYSYRSLLAGLYHKSGQQQQSVDTYNALLRDDGAKPEYWLGLAIGLDSLQRSGDALQAFKSALDPSQSEQVRQYIVARIQALSS